MNPSPQRDIRWLPFRNDAGESIPAYALLRITGVATVNGQTLHTAAKPNASTTHLVWAFNSDIIVASGGYGLCTFDYPAIAKVNTGVTTTNSAKYGPSNGQWYIVPTASATFNLVAIQGQTTAQGDTTVVDLIRCAG